MANRPDPSPNEVRDAMRRVLATESFRRSDRATALLEHLIARTLAGQTDALKGAAIAMDVFQRGAGFDVDNDSIVRVQVGRLRKMLTHYYLTDGATDPIVISLPRGTYVPVFEQRDGLGPEAAADDRAASADQPADARASSQRLEPSRSAIAPIDEPEPAMGGPLSQRLKRYGAEPARWGGVALLAALLIAVWAIVVISFEGGDVTNFGAPDTVRTAPEADPARQARQPGEGQGSTDLPRSPGIGQTPPGAGTWQARQAVLGSDRPSVAVIPLANLGVGGTYDYLSAGLSFQLIADLSRFKELVVVAAPMLNPDVGVEAALARLNEILVTRYALAGTTLVANDQIQVTLRLIDVQSEALIWSQSYDSKVESPLLFGVIERISADAAASIGQPFGILNREDNRRLLARGQTVTAEATSYECVLRYYHYAYQKTAEHHLIARDCLEAAITRDGNFSPAWSALASLYAEEHRQGFNYHPLDRPPLERALEAANRAVTLDPDDASAHQALGVALLASGQTARARETMERALRLNGNNADIMSDAGLVLALTGDWERGTGLVRDAIVRNPGHPPWYRGLLAIDAYRRGAYQEALSEALAFYNGEDALAHLVLIAVNARLGRPQIDASPIITRLTAAFPEFSRDPALAFRQWQLPADLISKFMLGLQAAGIGPAKQASSRG